MYTLDTLDIFFYKLQINTVLTLLINGITCYFVLHHSTPQMHHYKYYILMTVLSCALMDFHMSFIHGLYLTLPLAGTCCAGISRYFGNYMGPVGQYATLHYMVCATGVSIIMSILYRYYSLIGKVEFFHSKKIIPVWIAVLLVYPLPSTLVAVYARMDSTWEEELALVAEKAPQYTELYTKANCNTHTTNFQMLLDAVAAVIQIFTVYAFGIFYVVRIVRELRSVQSSLTAATYAMQKQLFVSLCFQIAIPSIFMVSPLFILLGTSTATAGEDANIWGELAIQIMALHGSVNGLSVLYFYKPYRKAVEEKLRQLFKKQATITVSPDTVVATLSQPSV